MMYPYHISSSLNTLNTLNTQPDYIDNNYK